jgi:hypothetical protein
MQVQQVTPELLVGGIGTSGDFYRNALGLELEVLYNVKGRPQYAQLGDGGIKVFLETAYGTKEFMFDDPGGYRIGIQELNN